MHTSFISSFRIVLLKVSFHLDDSQIVRVCRFSRAIQGLRLCFRLKGN